MPDIAINQPITISTSPENNEGPVTGLVDMTVTVIDRASGETIFSDSATETPSGSGTYSATIPASALDTPMWLSADFQSVAGGIYDRIMLRCDDIPGWAKTRREVRLTVARMLDGEHGAFDYRATAGSTTTATLPDLTFGGEGEYAGMWARFNDGLNRGLVRRLINYDEAGVIEWGEALPNAVVAGNRVELYKMDPRIIDGEINSAYSNMRKDAVIPYTDRMLTTDGTSTEFTLPVGMVRVARVGLADESGAVWLTPKSWSLVAQNRLSLGILGAIDPGPFHWPPRSRLYPLRAGMTIWVEGYAALNPPLYDESYVDLLPEYVEAHCHWRLAQMRPDMASVWPFLKRTRDEEMKRATDNIHGRGI